MDQTTPTKEAIKLMEITPPVREVVVTPTAPKKKDKSEKKLEKKKKAERMARGCVLKHKYHVVVKRLEDMDMIEKVEVHLQKIDVAELCEGEEEDLPEEWCHVDGTIKWKKDKKNESDDNTGHFRIFFITDYISKKEMDTVYYMSKLEGRHLLVWVFPETAELDDKKHSAWFRDWTTSGIGSVIDSVVMKADKIDEKAIKVWKNDEEVESLNISSHSEDEEEEEEEDDDEGVISSPKKKKRSRREEKKRDKKKKKRKHESSSSEESSVTDDSDDSASSDSS